MSNGMSHIEHLVVLMMENRSFDNLLGWLYGPDRPPSRVVGGASTDPPFFGLSPNSYWNPSNASYFGGAPAEKVFATEGTTGSSPFTVPDTDPKEDFDDITFQIFGTQTPGPGQAATMLGFLVDYQKVNPPNPAALMETYSPGQVTVTSGLAANFAVCDAWFASAPCQTWPNRAFVHAGTSCGRVNNPPYDPSDFDVPTIFNVLQRRGISWGVYSPGILPSLTKLQFPRLWDPALAGHFRSIDDFIAQAGAGTLPTYSFLEPDFMFNPDDDHAPHDVCLGEQFILKIYEAVSGGKGWDRTLLVITFDEHGGCPDHVPPPRGAVAPDPASDPGAEGFRFDRFGVRVPAILASPWIRAGMVFRSPTGVPFDHTSILATIRDWLGLPADLMLPSRRVAAAPTFGDVLDAPQARTDTPSLAVECPPSAQPWALADLPPNDLQRSMVAAMVHRAAGRRVDHALVEKVLAVVTTRARAVEFLTHPAPPG